MADLRNLTILHSNDMHGDFLAEEIDDDLVCDLYQRLVLINAKLFQHFCTDDGMRFHNLKFFFRQSARFIQNLVINANLADIMQG